MRVAPVEETSFWGHRHQLGIFDLALSFILLNLSILARLAGLARPVILGVLADSAVFAVLDEVLAVHHLPFPNLGIFFVPLSPQIRETVDPTTRADHGVDSRQGNGGSRVIKPREDPLQIPPTFHDILIILLGEITVINSVAPEFLQMNMGLLDVIMLGEAM